MPRYAISGQDGSKAELSGVGGVDSTIVSGTTEGEHGGCYKKKMLSAKAC